MKKLNKILLILLIALTLNPINIFAQEEVPPPEEQPEEIVVEENQMKVDEDNENPFLYRNKVENKDESNREKEIVKKPINTPASVTGEIYQGSGTVVDFTTTGAKAFYTIKGTENTIYYIVIDMDKTENNVYFLSEINGEELSLNDVTVQPQELNPEIEEPEPIKKNNNYFFWIVLVLGAIGFSGYHLLFGKLKDKEFNPFNKNKPKKENKDKDEKQNKEQNKEQEENQEQTENKEQPEEIVVEENEDVYLQKENEESFLVEDKE